MQTLFVILAAKRLSKTSLQALQAILTDPRRLLGVPQSDGWFANTAFSNRLRRSVVRQGINSLSYLHQPELGWAKTTDLHGEQQGMLLQLGALCGYETFTNSTDKVIRRFQGEPISKLATVRNDADDLLALPLEKMRNTDVMWMAEDSEGLYPKYAFEVEHSTKVKSGLLRLLRIPVSVSRGALCYRAG